MWWVFKLLVQRNCYFTDTTITLPEYKIHMYVNKMKGLIDNDKFVIIVDFAKSCNFVVQYEEQNYHLSISVIILYIARDLTSRDIIICSSLLKV